MTSPSYNLQVILLLLLPLLFIYCSDNRESYIDTLETKDRNELNNILQRAENNSEQLELALSKCPPNQRNGLLFLLNNMPDRDLKTLSSEFLLENIEYAYRIIDTIKWGSEIPEEIFMNYILPYVNIHERRDNWRKEFFTKFLPLVINLNSPSEATIKLNKEIWDILNVKYSTKRPKADQSPHESIKAGLASCTGLSILLIDACRAVGVPARFVGVPLWKDESGNHSWIEIWDNGWHYIGAAEQSPLNVTWFGERAKTSDDSNWKYSIYAASFKKTDVIFPPLFDKTATYVHAEIVTNRYSEKLVDDGLVALAIRLFDKPNGDRIEGDITILKDEIELESGVTKNEKSDYNDFLVFRVKPNTIYKLKATANNIYTEKEITTSELKYQFVELNLKN